jgi:hypothetical protein
MEHPETRVYVRHVRQCGFCLSGVRKWAELHGLDYRDFLSNGIPVSQILQIQDAYAKQIIDRAIKESL